MAATATINENPTNWTVPWSAIATATFIVNQISDIHYFVAPVVLALL